MCDIIQELRHTIWITRRNWIMTNLKNACIIVHLKYSKLHIKLTQQFLYFAFLFNIDRRYLILFVVFIVLLVCNRNDAKRDCVWRNPPTSIYYRCYGAPPVVPYTSFLAKITRKLLALPYYNFIVRIIDTDGPMNAIR